VRAPAFATDIHLARDERMNRLTGRLVDSEQQRIFVQNRERQIPG